jgi:hypothetical protein
MSLFAVGFGGGAASGECEGVLRGASVGDALGGAASGECGRSAASGECGANIESFC